jgi:hypothetical protein
LVDCLDKLEDEGVDRFSSDSLVKFFADYECGDIIVSWTDEQIKLSTQEGKIPKLDNWKELLSTKKIGLDALMNLGGLNSFKMDQKAMDNRVRDVLSKSK